MTGMGEPELQAEVIKLCEQLGLLYHHCPAAYRCAGQRGLPDLIIAGPRGIIFAELKGPETDTSAEQDQWLWTIGQLRRAHDLSNELVRAVVWRPADLASGSIAQELRWLI